MLTKFILVAVLVWATFTCFDRAVAAVVDRDGRGTWPDEAITYCIGGSGLLLASIVVLLGM